jgi:hypothetical protein
VMPQWWAGLTVMGLKSNRVNTYIHGLKLGSVK